jgi:hypothetical protein
MQAHTQDKFVPLYYIHGLAPVCSTGLKKEKEEKEFQASQWYRPALYFSKEVG